MKKNLFILLGLVAMLAMLVFFFGSSTVDGKYHLRTSGAGEATEDYLRTQIKACLNAREAGWRSRCFSELGGLLSSQFELPTILRALATIDEEPGIKQRCHTLVHFLGQNEFLKTGDLGATFRQCLTRAACGEGCFHGSVEAYVSEQGGDMSSRAIQSVCKRDAFEKGVNYLACNHGLGHAFMLESGNDVPASLALCDAVVGKDERDQCFGGVFMENVFSFGSPDHPTSYIRPEEPTYPCTILPERYRSECFTAQAASVIQYNRSNYDAGAAFCNELEPVYRATCFGSLGGNAVVTFDDPRAIKAVCDKAPAGPSRNECIHQALVFLGHGSEGSAGVLAELCFVADETEKEECFRSVGDVLESWLPGRREEQCALVNAKGTQSYKWCVLGQR